MKKISRSVIVACATILLLPACKKDIDEAKVNKDFTEVRSAARIAKPGYTLDEVALTAGGWNKTFADNFDETLQSSTLDTAKWKIEEHGGQYNAELQDYRIPNVEVTNGELQLIAKLETDGTITSGRVHSKRRFQPPHPLLTGNEKIRIYARIKLPAGLGMWSAFWTFDEPWPTKGEIDILEGNGLTPTSYQTNYLYGPISAVDGGSNEVDPNISEYPYNTGVDITSSYNVYMAEWSKNTITWYFNDFPFYSVTGHGIGKFQNAAQRIILNLAVGGNFVGNPHPTDIDFGLSGERILHMDWVKVYEHP